MMASGRPLPVWLGQSTMMRAGRSMLAYTAPATAPEDI